MFKSLAISKRVALGISIPLIGLLIVGSVATWNAYRDYNSSVILGYVTEAVNELAALTDTLQVERGQSAIMVGSGSKTPQLDLIAARKATDSEVIKLHIVNEHIHRSGDAELIKGLDTLEEELKTLDEMRAKINLAAVKLPDAMKYYSTTISHILDLGFVAGKKANNSELALEAIGMLQLAGAKEYAGQERGLVAGLIASNTVTRKKLSKLDQSIGRQDSLLAGFVQSQPPVTYDRFEAMINGVDRSKINAARLQIADAAYGEGEITISAKEWFALATERITALRTIEIEAIKAIDKGAVQVKDSFQKEALLMGFVSLLCLIGAIVAGYFIASSVRKDIFRTSDEMKSLAQGDMNIDISGVGDKTEIGKMAHALELFKQAGLEKQKLEEEALAGSQQRHREQVAREAEAAEQATNMMVVVENLGAGLQRFSECNISRTIDDPFVATFEKIRSDFNNSIGAFQETLELVLASTHTIQSTSAEMQDSSQNMSTRTEQQAASLEETAAALEQINVSVGHAAIKAEDTRKLASEAKNCAIESGVVVREAVSAMSRIETASSKISNIIGVIDEIAFQTNLLALNAGVEAARAGEAGKGFAVVAQEVRELASRSATAAKEIKDLIGNATTEVSTGSKLVANTGEALSQIEGYVVKVDANITEIVTGVEEQSQGLKEISSAMNDLDQTTQKNAAMAEESAALSQMLSSEASGLGELVNRFKLNRRGKIRSPEDRKTPAAIEHRAA